MARRSILVLGSLTAATAVAAIAAAQSRKPGKRYLHQDIAAPSDQTERTAQRVKDGIPVFGPEPSAKQNPTAVATQDKLLPEPAAAGEKLKDEPVHGTNDFGADRQTEAKLDRFTSADSTLHYIEVFNPSIVPFKRMSALDAVRDDFTLTTSSRALADLPVGGKPNKQSDRFWGSIMVQLRPGLDVPIPSVSPEMRILSYETEPAVDIVFSKDIADNYYVRTDETGKQGQYRVNFLAEAPPRYFAPQVPSGLRVMDIPRDRVVPLPPGVQEEAEMALSKLGLNRRQRVSEALDRLVYYFRGFDAKSPPPDTGNIYWDLFDNQAGVCRHRSFTFMVTANALGIPARYVTNEAHAFVEVWLPGSAWMRIDLGGAADTLNISNASDKAMYQPRGEDPFSQPDNYANNYTRWGGDIEGLRDDQIAERQRPYLDGNGNGDFFGTGDEVQDPNLDDGPLTGPGEGLPTIPDSELEGKLPTNIAVRGAAASGFRGESIWVEGNLADESGTGLAGMRIDVFLAPAGQGGNDAVLVGRGRSDDNGEFRIEFTVPTYLELSRYEVFASYPGNEAFRPSVSD
jgi:transglutaminase-like putative cysteine protease